MPPKHAKASLYLRSSLFDGVAHFRDLEARIEALPTPGERGAAFEVFVEAYLATQKTTQATEIWPEGTIPPAASKKLNLGGRHGVGIDGVYTVPSGECYAYQVKFRAGRPSLPYADVAPFFGITEAFTQRVLITNSDDLASQINDRPNTFCIRGRDFDRLEADDFAAIRAWLAGRPTQVPRKIPRSHQDEALVAILPALKSGDRATAVMACGSGKTLVALWVAERMEAKRILVLVPSLALIRQTLHEWLHETSWTDASFLCVCSDPSVAKGADQIQVYTTDLDFPVTTDGAVARRFLAGPGTRIVFSTYQSAKVVARGLGKTAKFDLGIFDEAHKTAGPEGKRNAFALKDGNLRIRKRLFVTATPRHASTTKRTKEGEQALVYSMDEPATYGPIVYTLGFAEAAERRIICDYKIVVSVVTSTSLNDELLRRGVVTVQDDSVKARHVANQVALQKAVSEYGVSHIFSFHGNVASAKSFTSDDPAGIGSVIPGIVARHVNGEMPTAVREGVIDEFKQAPLGIVSNARCLTEGVDLPAVDMVAFMSPKRSKVDIVQAAGRAMRIPPGKPDKETGFIFLPLYVEEKTGETIEEALERTGMDELVDVLNAMKEQDVVLADMIQAAQEERGRAGGFDDSRLGERLAVLGPTLSIEVLRHAITMRLVESVGVSWDFRYGELREYWERHGDCLLPRVSPENPELLFWVMNQRTKQKQGQLTADRMARLDALGFVWGLQDSRWEEKFAELEAFRGRHNHCNVPVTWAENPELGSWVATQRKRNRSRRLEPERVAQLDAIGFNWNPVPAKWDSLFEELKRFKAIHGHCRVPFFYAENPELGNWVASQRRSRSTGKLADERIVQLDVLGFDWDPHSSQWEERFSDLQGFRRNHQHCNVPAAWPDDPALGKWVVLQRHQKERGRLSEERVARLDEIAFVWDPFQEQWEKQFEVLDRFRTVHGHCRVPPNWEDGPGLASWTEAQRTSMLHGRLSAERVARLDSLGFDWNPHSSKWGEKLDALRAFRATNGHCNVPYAWPDDRELAKWVVRQRHLRNQGRLSGDRVNQLDALGFLWDARASRWESKYSALEAYRATHEDCNVPPKWPGDVKLGSWIKEQRVRRRAGKLSPDRIARLDALGFRW